MDALRVASMVLMIAAPAAAQQATLWPSGGLTLEQIEALSAPERDRLPAFDLARALDQRAAPIIRRQYIFAASAALRQLHFYNGSPVEELTPQFTAAIRSFQAALGEPADGVLSVGQATRLFERLEQERISDVGVVSPFSVSVGQDIGTARGTWTIQGERIAHPLQTAAIYCARVTATCVIFQAEIMDGLGPSRFLGATTTTYRILRWGSGEIVSEQLGQCRATTMHMNERTGEVFQITRNVATSTDCILPPLAVPRMAHLVDGGEIAMAVNRQRREAASRFYAPTYRDAVSRLREEMERLERGRPAR